MEDPVCKMTVDSNHPLYTYNFEGNQYTFCSGRCLEKFKNDPDSFLHPQSSLQSDHPSSSLYTCPMHQEILQDHPGSCPLCGMALEPLLNNAQMDDAEEKSLKKDA